MSQTRREFMAAGAAAAALWHLDGGTLHASPDDSSVPTEATPDPEPDPDLGSRQTEIRDLSERDIRHFLAPLGRQVDPQVREVGLPFASDPLCAPLARVAPSWPLLRPFMPYALSTKDLRTLMDIVPAHVHPTSFETYWRVTWAYFESL